MTHHLNVDLETFSSEPIQKVGLYKYVQSPDFEILLFGYSLDGYPVQVLDLTQQPELPGNIKSLLLSPAVIKHAFNAAFEWQCLSKYLNLPDPCSWLPQWQDTQLHALYCGYPASLDAVGKAIGLPPSQQKLSTGKALIRTFCIPHTPTDRDPRTRIRPAEEPEKWELFKEYNRQDVATEMEVARRLAPFPVPAEVQKQWQTDLTINARGVALDLDLIRGALDCSRMVTDPLMAEAQRITGLDNPNSLAQVKGWLQHAGHDVDTLRKDDVSALLTDDNLDDTTRRVLEIRQELGKTSNKKYDAMLLAVCADGRIRGTLQFYGANRSGRWAGRLIQPQNLPRTNLHDGLLDLARDLVKARKTAAIDLIYGSVQDTLSQLIRTALVPSPGHLFVDADFSAIEARVIAWLAGEEHVLEVFRGDGKIYEATAAQMFGVPMEKIIKGNPEYALRQKGKVATLACIAEGELVLTDSGLIPIEKVSLSNKLWDGERWVNHEGLIYRGEKEVITYDGLTATPDHPVWIEGQSEPIQFGFAATSGAHLLQTGTGWYPIRLGKDHQPGKALERDLEYLLCIDPMYRLWEHPVDNSKQPTARNFKGLPKLLPTETDTAMVGSTSHGSKTEVQEPKGCRISRLWRTWHRILFSVRYRSRTVDRRESGITTKRNGNRQDRQQWKLRTWEYPVYNKNRKQRKPQNHRIIEMGSKILALCPFRRYKKAIGGDDTRANYSRCPASRKRKAETLALNRRKVRVYDLQNAGPHHRFTVSGRLVHNCGYGGSVGALIAMGALKMGLKEEELPDIVQRWRDSNRRIVDLWYKVDNAAINVAQTGRPAGVRGLLFALEGDQATDQYFLTIALPSGRKLYYVRPTLGTNRWGRPSINYWDVDQQSHKWVQIETYGGKLVENCLSGRTIVLTSRGWIPIKKVFRTDRLWDGSQWVNHGGVIYKGHQQTMSIDGVYLTPEHKILTKEGWQNASSCKRYHRDEVKLPNSNKIRRVGRKKVSMGNPLRLRKRDHYASYRIFKGEAEIMRMQKIRNHFRSPYYTWTIKASSLSCLALHERKVPVTHKSSMGKLRRQRNQSMRQMAERFRSILGRYGADVQKRALYRSDRCKWRLLPGKLSMGDRQKTGQKQKGQHIYRHALGIHHYCRSLRPIRNRKNNSVLPIRSRMPKGRFFCATGRYEPVYDLMDAGPNHCFTVWSTAGPMVVHNCVQAIARDCLAENIEHLEGAGYKVVIHIHDEIVIDAPPDQADLDTVIKIMSQPIPWAPGLPMAADGWTGNYYTKD